MDKELFGVIGDRETFDAIRSTDDFHVILQGKDVTVGVRDPWLAVSGRTTFHEDEDGFAVVWGEAFVPTTETPARVLKARFERRGFDAFDSLNGSYVAVVAHGSDVVVATDTIRSWECFYSDRTEPRLFGTDCGAIANLLTGLQPDRTSLRELLYVSVVLGDRTLFDGIRRVPFDGYLTGDGEIGEFDRFVYDPQEFDYATELARRLRHALGRRADYPGRKGLLLSAGQDSRTVLAEIPDIDHTYTVGSPDSDEVAVARRLAEQYDVGHTVFTPDRRYLDDGGERLRYTGSCRESLHAHHAGYNNEITVDTIYHGLLYDTLFKGYFIQRDSIGPSGLAVNRKRPDPAVDPVEGMVDTLGCLPGGYECAGALVESVGDITVDDPEQFVRDRVSAEFARCRHRADSPANLMDCFAVRTQPAMAFRTQLADRYLEANVPADAELVDWHLRTPPTHRHVETVHDALVLLDADIFRHPPPNRPYRSELLNQAHRFARRVVPGLSATEPSWPDRDACYEAHALDEAFFPDTPEAEELSVRRKLRLRDARWWLP